MKRSFRAKTALLFTIVACFFLPPAAFGESGAADPNALLAFKRLFIEPVQDNVDGAYQAPVSESYRAIFDRNPRFELVTERSQADTIVRTIVNKKSTGTDLDISLLLSPTGELFTTEHETISTSATGRETGAKVKALLKAALKRIPFYGTVTGRDGQELTFDIGSAHGLRKGDVIQLSRIDNIKRHPLLKSIVDVQLVPVGDAVIDSTEDTISFGHVKSEITGEKIQKLQKVTAIEARAALPETVRRQRPEKTGSAYVESTMPERNPDRPQIGFVSLGVQLSSFSNSTSAAGGATVSGGGFSPGARVGGELWLTKNWFADMTLGFAAVSYSNDDATTSYSTSTHTFSINAGYRYLPDNNLYGPQVSAKIGYANWGWSTPVAASDLLSSKSYSGLDLGLGGTLPITTYDWGVMLNINIMLFPGLSEDEAFKVVGTDSSASGATFYLAGYHYFNPKLAVRAGPLVETFSADNSAGSSTSQKTFGLLTSLLYFF